MDRLEAMSLLLETVNAGSLSAAARHLDIPLATISRKISDLESHIGTSLFNRTGRRIQLTEAGLAYAAACRRILDEVGEAERAASGEYSNPKGDLHITAPIVFGRLHVLPLVIAFLKAYPEISIKMTLTDQMIDLSEQHVDLAVRLSELPDSSLIAQRLGLIRRVVCGSPVYLAARGVPQQPEDLGGHSCITRVANGFTAVWEFQRGNKVVPVPFRPRLVVTTAEAAIDAALASLGVTQVFSYQIAAAVAAGALVEVLQPFEPAPLPVSLVYHRERLLPQKLRVFLDFAGPKLKAELARDRGGVAAR